MSAQPALPNGLKAWYEYGETYVMPSGRQADPFAPRRYVRAHVVNADRKEVATGIAVCNPVDQFVKRTGRAKALGRALSRLQAEVK